MIRPGRVLTRFGVEFDLLNPHPDMVDGFDISHALGNLCRYNGHTSRFYSVAEHCVLMSYAVPPEDALWALLHDATEAYVGDMVSPLKAVIPQFSEIEDKIMGVICERFDLPVDMPASVRVADERIRFNERLALYSGWRLHEGERPLDVEVEGWVPAYATQRYLRRLMELYKRSLWR